MLVLTPANGPGLGPPSDVATSGVQPVATGSGRPPGGSRSRRAAQRPPPDAGGAPSAEELFTLLWDAMADLLGTAATAALLRRASRRGTDANTALEGVEIERDDLTYRYRLPAHWRRQDDEASIVDLRALCAALRPLLIDLTGPVVARRLDHLTPLRDRGIAFLLDEAAQ